MYLQIYSKKLPDSFFFGFSTSGDSARCVKILLKGNEHSLTSVAKLRDLQTLIESHDHDEHPLYTCTHVSNPSSSIIYALTHTYTHTHTHTHTQNKLAPTCSLEGDNYLLAWRVRSGNNTLVKVLPGPLILESRELLFQVSS